MRRSWVVMAVSAVVAAAAPLATWGQGAESEFGSSMPLASSVVAADFRLAKTTDASPSEAKTKPAVDRDDVPPVAERKSYLLLLAGVGAVAFVASRRRLG